MDYVLVKTEPLFRSFKNDLEIVLKKNFISKLQAINELIQTSKTVESIERHPDVKCIYQNFKGLEALSCESQNFKFLIIKTGIDSFDIFKLESELNSTGHDYFRYLYPDEIKKQKKWFDDFLFNFEQTGSMPGFTHDAYLSIGLDHFLLKCGKSVLEEIKTINELDFIITLLSIKEEE